MRKLSEGVASVLGMELVEARPVWSMDGSELLTSLDRLHAEAAARETYRLQIMDRLDEIGYAKELGARDVVELLAMRHRLDPAAVRSDLKLAKNLAKYPVVTAALPDPFAATSADGTVQYADADADADADVGGAAEPVGGSGEGEPGERLPVVLHVGQAKAIVTALDQIPAAVMVPVEDLQVAEEQMVEAARFLAPADLRKLGRTVRDTLDSDGPEPAEDKASRKEAFWMKNADHGITFGGFVANENAELVRTGIHALSKPHKAVDGAPDPRSREKRQADALVAVFTTAADGRAGWSAPAPTSAPGTPGASGGGGFKVLVTIDFDDLKTAGKNATGDLTFGDNLSAAAVRRLACDAEILPIVLGSNSQPLDVGTSKRFVTGPMRDALIERDRGCVICKAPPSHCHAHHIVHWADGGETSVDNLALFCGAHHTGVHHGHWTVTILDGVVHLSYPDWAEPDPTTRQRRPPPHRSPQPSPPPTGDIPWITKEDAARLDPWGDEGTAADLADTG